MGSVRKSFDEPARFCYDKNANKYGQGDGRMSADFSLAKAYEKYFKIGAAVTPYQLQIHGDLIARQFSSITPENEMKYEPIEPEEGQFHFDLADKIAAFGREKGIKVRAHAPVWHNQTGAWMYKDGDRPAAPELIYERIDAHSKAMCERYNDAVYAWDVVNEAVRDDVADLVKNPEESDVLRSSDYSRLCGYGFIEAAFRSMDKYSPNAQLFYNDYNECQPDKRERIVKLIRYLQDRGCRVDGMGMQQHHFGRPDFDEIKKSIETYAALGLRLHITELDVGMMAVLPPDVKHPKPEDPGFEDFMRKALTATPETLKGVNDIYVKLFEIYRSYADVIDCVTTWGVADDYTWMDGFGPNRKLRIKQHPLLFDEQEQPKPCVLQMMEAVK